MSSGRRLSTRTWALAGAAFFLSAFLLYLHSSPASLYLDDSGETVSVAALLGIGHPPGYPLHTLIGRLVSLLPFAGPAWRVNLLAVLWGALLAAGLALECTKAALRRDLGAASAWMAGALIATVFTVGPVQWHNALGAKGSIYELNNLFSLALLVLAADAGPRRQKAFWLLLGLAMAHHYMSQLPLLPAYAWLLWPQRKGLFRRAWLLAPGVLLYAYLPLRSWQEPDLAWGRFHSWQDFWFFFFRLQYAAGELTRSAATSWAQAVHAAGLLLREGGGALSALALFGLWRLRRERRIQAWALGLAASLAAVTFYLNLKPERLDLMQPYLFPAYLCQALLAAEGLALALQSAGAPLTALLPALGLSACAVLAWGRWDSLSLRRYYYATDNARSLLLSLPKDSLLLAQGDALIFPLWYLQRVLHERDDVAVVGLAVLPMDWVREDLARWHPDLRHPQVRGPIGAESVPRLTEAYLALNRQRPQYAAFNRFDDGVDGWRLVSEGPTWRVQPLDQAPAEDRTLAGRHIQAERFRGFFRRPLDPRTLTLIVGDRAIQANSLGVSAEEAKAYPEALAWYRLASAVHPEDPDYPFNAGNVLYAMGRFPQAIAAFQAAVALDRGYLNGWYNLGVTLYQRGQRGEALKAFQQVLRLDPSKSDVRQIADQLSH